MVARDPVIDALRALLGLDDDLDDAAVFTPRARVGQDEVDAILQRRGNAKKLARQLWLEPSRGRDAGMPLRHAPLQDHLAYVARSFRENPGDGVVLSANEVEGLANYLDWMAQRARQEQQPRPENVLAFCPRASAAHHDYAGPGGDAA